MPAYPLHPFSTASHSRLQVLADWPPQAGAALQLTYELHAGDLRLPPPAPAQRSDLLWQHTCCELFIATVNRPNYREFNFAPSGAWAVYDFADYRQRLPDPALAAAPTMVWHSAGASHSLQVTLPAALLPPGPWQIGLSTILENEAGELAYWALHHPGEQPDFHRRDAFTLLIDPLQS